MRPFAVSVVGAMLSAGVLGGAVLLGSAGCEASCETKRNCGPYDGALPATSSVGGGSTTSSGGGTGGEGGVGGSGGFGGQGGEAAIEPAIFAGGPTTCAVREGGDLLCWGETGYSTLGTRPSPTAIPVTSTRAVAISSTHFCRLTSERTVECWGSNMNGQLGFGTYNDSTISLPVNGLPTTSSVAVGAGHSCALGETGTLLCWGDNATSQLTSAAPKPDSPLPFIIDNSVSGVATGSQHTCTVQDGDLFCWGSNLSGQVDPALTPFGEVAAPHQLIFTGDFSSVSVGDAHSCALTQMGQVVCWGDSSFGQLAEAGPALVAGLPADVRQVAAGANHTCARLGSGDVWCWGVGSQGQLGDGLATTSPVPRAVTSLQCASVMLASGGNHTCSLCADGRVFCWGANGQGQLGIGGIGGSSDTPSEVSF